MSQSIVDALRRRLDAIHRQYEGNFAGQPRITRDPALLDAMVAEVTEVAEEARALEGAGEVAEAAAKNKELYENEAKHIRDARELGPEAYHAQEIATWAQLCFSRYRRHFAGKPRGTRDVELLAELKDEVARLSAELQPLLPKLEGGSHDWVRDALSSHTDLFGTELQAIRDARKNGSLDERASILAGAANGQFQLYADHFAGKERVSRRPALLQRMVRSLEGLGNEMRGLKSEGLEGDPNESNISVVDGRLTTFSEELEHVRSTKHETPPGEIAGALGNSANAAFAEYREHFAGRDRSTRDPDMLSRLCDELHDLARQMSDLRRILDDEALDRNLNVVLDNLRLYEAEHEKVLEVRSQ
jgi:hypothetical protein